MQRLTCVVFISFAHYCGKTPCQPRACGQPRGIHLDNANKLDKVLKGDTSLTWFVSIFPPKRPHPVPLMSLKLPPLPVGYANDHPIPLMSLKLPPLPETYTSGQYSQKSQSQATQDFLGRGIIPLKYHRYRKCLP